MSALLKLLPLLAIGYFGYANADVLKRNFDVISNVQTEATSSIEMQQIADAVAQEYITENTIPLNNFPEFLEQNMREADGKKKRDFSKDLWGTQFRIARAPGGFQIESAGPDKKWATSDDINVVRNLKQYGGTGEPGASPVTPSQKQAQPESHPTSSEPAITPEPATPPPAPPPPEHKPYQWKRS